MEDLFLTFAVEDNYIIKEYLSNEDCTLVIDIVSRKTSISKEKILNDDEHTKYITVKDIDSFLQLLYDAKYKFVTVNSLTKTIINSCAALSIPYLKASDDIVLFDYGNDQSTYYSDKKLHSVEHINKISDIRISFSSGVKGVFMSGNDKRILSVTLLTELVEKIDYSKAHNSVKHIIKRLASKIIKRNNFKKIVQLFTDAGNLLYGEENVDVRTENDYVLITIKLPTVEIRNEAGLTDTITDPYFIIRLRSLNGAITFSLQRASFHYDDVDSGFTHPHLHEQMSNSSGDTFCLGASYLSSFKTRLERDLNKEEKINEEYYSRECEYLISYLETFISYEDLEHIPYISMSSKYKISASNWNISNSSTSGRTIESEVRRILPTITFNIKPQSFGDITFVKLNELRLKKEVVNLMSDFDIFINSSCGVKTTKKVIDKTRQSIDKKKDEYYNKRLQSFSPILFKGKIIQPVLAEPVLERFDKLFKSLVETEAGTFSKAEIEKAYNLIKEHINKNLIKEKWEKLHKNLLQHLNRKQQK